MKNQPLLITGATGFLGRHLMQTLSDQLSGQPLLALLRNPQAWQSENWTGSISNVGIIEGAVTDRHWENDERLQNLGGLFHLAALVRHSRSGQAGEIYQTNVEGTLNMVRLAAKHKCRMVFVSTSGTVGCFKDPDKQANEHAPYCLDTVSGWPYYHSKIQAETMAQELAQELGVDLVIMRPPALLGPGDHRFRSTSHIIRFMRRRLPFLIEGGIHFADVRDAANAIIQAMRLPAAKPIYHLCGTSCRVTDFFQMVSKTAGIPAPRRTLPYPIAHALSNLTWRVGLLPDPVVVELASHYWGLSSLYAAKDLGYRSRPGAETIADTVEWLRNNHPDLSGDGGKRAKDERKL